MKGKVILYAKFNYSQAKVALAQAWAFIAHKINGERKREREREREREEKRRESTFAKGFRSEGSRSMSGLAGNMA